MLGKFLSCSNQVFFTCLSHGHDLSVALQQKILIFVALQRFIELTIFNVENFPKGPPLKFKKIEV